MYRFIAQGLHIILAIAVLLSTTGITINRHLCQNTLVDTALFVRADACGMHTNQAKKESGFCKKHPTKNDGNCCQDKSDYYKLDQEKQITVEQFKPLKQAVSLALPWYFLSAPVVRIYTKVQPYLHYRPPLIRSNLQVLLQVFRL
ncbi:MAG: hypothetical protein R3D58_07325 [Saprospiraceae bacterium]